MYFNQASAREKAFNNAKKNIKNISITKEGSIRKEVSAKCNTRKYSI